jgi:hypothetical protein
MLRTMTLAQGAEDQPGVTEYDTAVVHRAFAWADEAAADHDYAGALAWLEVIEAIGCPLPEGQLRKRATWARAQRRS